MRTNLEYALFYAGLGWHVLPLWPEKKTPMTKNGYKDATKDEDQIRSWWSKTPDANIGLATGRISKLFVIDVDMPEDKAKKLDLFLPAFPTVKTARGSHYYICYPNSEYIESRSFRDLPIDIKSDGGYVVAPPSIHPSGERYEFVSVYP